MKSLKYLWISSPFTFLGVTVLEMYNLESDSEKSSRAYFEQSQSYIKL